MPYIDIEGEIPSGLDAFSNYQAYNILDSCVTAQLLPVIKSRMNENHLKTYRREMRVLALCLEMSTKGFPIDQFALAELLYSLEKDEARAQDILHKFCAAVDCRPINPRSTKDVPYLFYEHLGLPPVYEFDRKTKQKKITTDEKALEKLRGTYPIAVPFVNAILACRETRKMASVFKRGLEPDTFNLRCHFSPTGTETGRLASQQNPYGRGTNAQNLTDRVRQVITAPDGYAIINLDLKTAESIAVGFLSRCKAYIDACLSGDVHTAACRLNWPKLPWTGDIKADKEIAEQPYYRMFSYRDMMKRGGHGTNYYGKAITLAKILGVQITIMEAFQQSYFGAFPEIADWHLETIARIQQDGVIITPHFNRERRFWGRPDDAATHREAIAYGPQSLVADAWNAGLVQLQDWIIREQRNTIIDLRAQVHDSGVFLVPIEALDELVPEMQRRVEYPIDFGDLGVMLIPTEAQVGRRWCKVPKKQKRGVVPIMYEGLKDWTPGQELHWL